MFADLQREIAEQTQHALANASVQLEVGEPFAARLQTAGDDAFGAVVGTHTLRYLTSAGTLTMGQVIQVDGASFRVLEPPRQINRHECVAQVSEA